MRKKLKLSELPKNVKRKYKDECMGCNTYKEDVHSYYDDENNVYLLCPDCLKKNKSVIRNWKNELIEREDSNEKRKSNKKTRSKQSTSKDDNDKRNIKNGN